MPLSNSSKLRKLVPNSLVAGITLAISPLCHASSVPHAKGAAIPSQIRSLPMSFERNDGQANPAGQFLAHSGGYSVLFNSTGADFLLSKGPQSGLDAKQSAGAEEFRLRLQHGGEHAKPSPEMLLPGTVNYIQGKNRSDWHTSIPTFERLRYRDVYPGVDLVYHGSQDRLEFDFEVASHTSPARIQFRFDGAKTVECDRQGNLHVAGQDGSLTFQKPTLYQYGEGNLRLPVKGGFLVARDGSIRFSVGRYDSSKPLIIDPILNYSTYFDGASIEAFAVDSAGEVFVSGDTLVGVATTPGVLHPTGIGMFVSKFNSTGTGLVYSTYITGTVDSGVPGHMTVDAEGDAYIVGETGSQDFPVTPGAVQPTNKTDPKEGTTGFILELNPTGTDILYGTYFGGSRSTQMTSIALDSSKNMYVTGRTFDSDFPTTAGAFQASLPSTKASNSGSGFVSRIDSTGTQLVYSTYLTGTYDDGVAMVAVDADGSAYLVGYAFSPDFPTTAGAFQTVNHSDVDTAFVTKLNPSGSGLVYSTFLGGKWDTVTNAITLDAAGEAYVTGSTGTPDFPTTPGVIQRKLGSENGQYGENAFVTKFSADGSKLIFSTLLGGGYDGVGGIGDDSAGGIALDATGNIFIAGHTTSLDFPLTPGAMQTENLAMIGTQVAASFVAKINPKATALLYSTYLSGDGDLSGDSCDCNAGVALDEAGNVYVAGNEYSLDFPITLGAFQTKPYAGFITEFNGSEMTSLPIPSVNVTSDANPQRYGKTITFTATVQSTSGHPATGTVGFSYSQTLVSDGIAFGPGPWITVPLDSSGSATLSVSSLDPTNITVLAHYLGDAYNAPNVGTMVEEVTPIPTTIKVVSSANPVLWGKPFSLTAKVLDDKGKPATGISVSFVIDSVVQGQATVDSSGNAAWLTGSGATYFDLGTTTVAVEFLAQNGYAGAATSIDQVITPLGTTPAPTFDPPAGTYTFTQQIQLQDSDKNTTIYDTKDGSDPTTSGVPFNTENPVIVNATMTVKAIAVAPGYSPSAITSAAYQIVPPPDFTLGVTPNSISLSPGQTGSLAITIGGVNGFADKVTLKLSALPAGVTASFSSNPAGAGNAKLTLTAAGTASNQSKGLRPSAPFLLAIPVALLIMNKRTARARLLLFACLACVAITVGACGGGTSGGGTQNPPSSVTTVVVTGTDGNLSHTAQFVVTVN
jgi:hypothetical protein